MAILLGLNLVKYCVVLFHLRRLLTWDRNMISWYRTILGHALWPTSCNIDFIFTPKLFGLLDTPLAHSFCIADGSPNNQKL